MEASGTRVLGCVTCTYGQVVDPGPEDGSSVGGQDGDQPPVVGGAREHVQAPPGHRWQHSHHIYVDRYLDI